jgi:hypothetical protein
MQVYNDTNDICKLHISQGVRFGISHNIKLYDIVNRQIVKLCLAEILHNASDKL